jgi:hypothetical protein
MSQSFTELPEAEASGRIAEIYAEIRHFYGVPYVSSLQRHLATIPGVLEWGWAAVRPAFASGALPAAAWEAADAIDLEPLPKLSRPALRLLGVDEGGLETIRLVCRSFETVAPLNMAMGATIRALLSGERAMGPATIAAADAWQPPAPLPPPPATMHPDAVDADTRAVLLQLAADMDGERFVPGLYRQLAHWPAYLAHTATGIAPLFGHPDLLAAFDGLRGRIATRTLTLLYGLPPPPPAPANAPVAHILAAIEAYQQTSPQMICFGKLLREALPD